MVNDLDALRTAKLLLNQRGEQEAWRILRTRAVREHFADQAVHQSITQQVLSALGKLTTDPDGKGRH